MPVNAVVKAEEQARLAASVIVTWHPTVSTVLHTVWRVIVTWHPTVSTVLHTVWLTTLI